MDILDSQIVRIWIVLVVAIVLQLASRRSVNRLVQRVVEAHHYKSRQIERQREETLIGILRTVCAAVIWILAVIVILGILEVNIATLLTGAGLLGVIVGLGGKDIIKDFVGGLFIITENQYRVGDIVSIGGKSGMVESITIRVTRLRDLDGYLHIIPNGHADAVTNMTFDYANVNMNIGVSYDSDIEKVKKAINNIGKKLAHDPDWHELINQPITFLRIDSFDQTAVTVKALGQVAPGKQWDVAGEFRRRLIAEFEKDKISIPFQQRIIETTKD